jgi:hypothetical protein
MPQSSLRTALQQLESMASYKAARIMDKLNAGLQKVTSHRVFEGVLRQGTVGREVRRTCSMQLLLGSALGHHVLSASNCNHPGSQMLL